jgi:hypothetical protein
MNRIPEPELMNEAEQARAYAQADFAEPYDRCIKLDPTSPNLKPEMASIAIIKCELNKHR